MKTALMIAVAAGWLAAPALAADMLVQPLSVEAAPKAVSAVNGKIEFDGGYLTIPTEAAYGRMGGSLSLPIGDAFGAQLDAAVRYSGGEVAYGGAVHLFTRDPAHYLAGVTGAMIRGDDMTLSAIGPEAELYLDQVSVEAWGGYVLADYDDEVVDDISGGFAMADLAFYPTENLRLTAGLSYIVDLAAVHFGAEYLLEGMPVSIASDLRYDQNGDYLATVGVKGYFGGNGSLIERHRQDDPRNRAFDLMAVGQTYLASAPEGGNDGPPPDPIDTDEECQLENGPGWFYDEVYGCQPS